MTLPPTPSSPLPITLCPRVLEGLFALSSFLINQTTRFLKSPTISPERRRIARENVPWNKVADPVGLTREFRKNIMRAMGKELDAECFKPHGVEEDDGIAATANGNATTTGRKGGVKRKGTEEASPGPKSAKIKLAGSATSPPPVGGLNNQGDIISRQSIPVPPSTRFEQRIDPSKPALGARGAEVREIKNSQVVVRRWEENGETFVETRTVHTIVERVKWSNSIKAEERTPQSTYQPYAVTPPALPPNSHSAPLQSVYPQLPPYPYHPYAHPHSQPPPFYQYSYFSQPPQFAMNAQAPINGSLPHQHSYPPVPVSYPPPSQISPVSFPTPTNSKPNPDPALSNPTSQTVGNFET